MTVVDYFTGLKMDEMCYKRGYPLSEDMINVFNWWIDGDGDADTRLNFLIKLMSLPEFQFFNTSDHSRKFLEESDQVVIVRLSTTVQGGITITFKVNNWKVLHTRYYLLGEGKIADGKGNFYDDIESLVNLFKTTRVFQIYQ